MGAASFMLKNSRAAKTTLSVHQRTLTTASQYRWPTTPTMHRCSDFPVLQEFREAPTSGWVKTKRQVGGRDGARSRKRTKESLNFWKKNFYGTVGLYLGPLDRACTPS